jgi:hypothetical protein
MGRWKELRKELAGDKEEVEYTIRQFAEVYFEEYCKVRNTRPDFKEERLKIIKNIVGDVKLLEFTSAHAAYFEKERAKEVNPRTGKPNSRSGILDIRSSRGGRRLDCSGSGFMICGIFGLRNGSCGAWIFAVFKGCLVTRTSKRRSVMWSSCQVTRHNV